MEKIKRTSLYKEQVYREIKDAIISGRIAPGQKLNERKLAAELGVSRTPLREALQMLANDEWVSIEPWRGVIVKPLNDKDVRDAYAMRLLLECKAIETICDVITDEMLCVLNVLVEKMKYIYMADLGAAAFTSIDLEFHTVIVKATTNKLLIRWHANICDMMARLSVLKLGNKGRFATSMKEHEQILLALRERNKEKAVAEIKNHFSPFL